MSTSAPATSAPKRTFSAAVSPGKRLKLWKMKLTVERRNPKSSPRFAPVIRRPATVTVPEVAVSSAPIRLRSARLPAFPLR